MTGTRFTSLMHRMVAASPLTLTATLAGTPASVSVARRLVREALPDCPRADDLMLAVTELAANSVHHSASGQGGSFTVRLRTGPCWARIEITDEGPATGPAESSNGWGLAIVTGITDRSAATIGPDGHRTAWAEATVRREAL